MYKLKLYRCLLHIKNQPANIAFHFENGENSSIAQLVRAADC